MNSSTFFNSYLSSNGQRTLCAVPCSTIEILLSLPFDGDNSDPEEAYVKVSLNKNKALRFFPACEK